MIMKGIALASVGNQSISREFLSGERLDVRTIGTETRDDEACIDDGSTIFEPAYRAVY